MVARRAGSVLLHWLAFRAVKSTVKPGVMITSKSSDQTVERTERSLVHSDSNRRRARTDACGPVCDGTSVGPMAVVTRRPLLGGPDLHRCRPTIPDRLGRCGRRTRGC